MHIYINKHVYIFPYSCSHTCDMHTNTHEYFIYTYIHNQASLVAQLVKNPPAMQET